MRVQPVNKRNMAICAWCRNNQRQVCTTECQPEGRYRYFDPETRPDWEPIPSLPSLRELMSWSPTERLAIVYLALYYLVEESKRAM